MTNKYLELRAINVSEHIEKKASLSYLSWSWAVDTLLQHDPLAVWEYKDPIKFGATLMVFCSVTAFGKTMTSQLPVMDNKNKAIANPDAMDVNKAMQRCLAKAIALHGIGLYIYAGEDLPESPPEPLLSVDQLTTIRDAATEVNLSVNAICKAGKVQDLSEIHAASYTKLLTWIKSQKKEAA